MNLPSRLRGLRSRTSYYIEHLLSGPEPPCWPGGGLVGLSLVPTRSRGRLFGGLRLVGKDSMLTLVN